MRDGVGENQNPFRISLYPLRHLRDDLVVILLSIKSVSKQAQSAPLKHVHSQNDLPVDEIVAVVLQSTGTADDDGMRKRLHQIASELFDLFDRHVAGIDLNKNAQRAVDPLFFDEFFEIFPAKVSVTVVLHALSLPEFTVLRGSRISNTEPSRTLRTVISPLSRLRTIIRDM